MVLTLLILVLIGGLYFWKTRTTQQPAPVITEIPSNGVLPVVGTSAVNSAEGTSGANPYDKTNPFSNIKVNPFE